MGAARRARVAIGEDALWVANADDRTVSRIDSAQPAVVRDIPVPGSAELTGLASGAGAVWLGTGLTGPLRVYRISPSFDEIAETVRVGNARSFYEFPWQKAVGPGSVWTPGGGFGTERRLDPATMEPGSTVAIGVPAIDVALGHGADWSPGA